MGDSMLGDNTTRATPRTDASPYELRFNRSISPYALRGSRSLLDYGPQDSVHTRNAERTRAGFAPATFAGITTALGNAVGLLSGATNPMGLAGLGMTATGTRPGGILGDITDAIFGGGIGNVPGNAPWDRDLVDAINRGMPLGSAVAEQERRNRERALSGLTAPGRSMANRGGFGPSGGGGPIAGGGISSGNVTGGPGYGTAR